MKTLIIGPSWIGDMVISQSLYIALKEIYPDSQIDILAPKWCLDIANTMPEINNTIEMPLGHGDFNLLTRYKIGIKLRKEKYERAIVLPNSFKSALIPFFANIPMRTGWCGEMRYGLINDLRPKKDKYPQVVQNYMSLAYPSNTEFKIKYPKLIIDDEFEMHTMRKFIIDKETNYFAFAPGAEYGNAKQWFSSYFAEVAINYANLGYDIYLLGSAKDNDICSIIYDQFKPNIRTKCHNLAGKTTLQEAIAILKNARITIANDSGLLHLAAAVGSYVIGIYGPTPASYAPPLSNNSKVLQTNLDCQPCKKRQCPLQHKNCMKQITPKMVINNINSIIEVKSC